MHQNLDGLNFEAKYTVASKVHIHGEEASKKSSYGAGRFGAREFCHYVGIYAPETIKHIYFECSFSKKTHIRNTSVA